MEISERERIRAQFAESCGIVLPVEDSTPDELLSACEAAGYEARGVRAWIDDQRGRAPAEYDFRKRALVEWLERWGRKANEA